PRYDLYSPTHVVIADTEASYHHSSAVSIGEDGSTPAAYQHQTQKGPAGPTAQDAAAAGQDGGHIAARGLYGRRPGRDQRRGATDQQSEQRLRPAPVEGAEPSAEVFRDRHDQPGERQPDQRAHG